MIKTFCDVCGKEIVTKRGGNRLKRELGKVQTEVMVAVNGTWNSGAVCDACLLEVIVNGTDLNQ